MLNQRSAMRGYASGVQRLTSTTNATSPMSSGCAIVRALRSRSSVVFMKSQHAPMSA